MLDADHDALDRLIRLQANLAGHQPLPDDLRDWLLDGLRRYRETGDLTEALGLRLSHGAGFNACSLIDRARMEGELRRIARLVGPLNDKTAEQIARVMAGEAKAVPSIALDFLWKTMLDYGDALPRSKSALAHVLKGGSVPGRLGLFGQDSCSGVPKGPLFSGHGIRKRHLSSG